MLKQINILGLRCRKLRTFPGKFLNFGKSAGVKDLTNIMSEDVMCNFLKLQKQPKMYLYTKVLLKLSPRILENISKEKYSLVYFNKCINKYSP